MRTHTTVIATVFIVASWLLAGCSDSTAPAGDVVLTAEVNGIAFHPTSPSAPPTHAVFYEGDNSLSIGGLRSGGAHTDQIGFALRNVTGPGTYTLGDPATDGSGFYVISAGRITDSTFTVTAYWTSGARRGTAVVTAFEPSTQSLRGTFAFEAETGTGAWVSVTRGSFTGHYQTSHAAGL